MPTEIDDSKHSPGLVVGIGASSSDLQSLRNILTGIPRESSVAIVIIPESGGDGDQAILAKLGEESPRPIVRVVDGQLLTSGEIYLTPADRGIELLDDGQLHVADLPVDERWAPIDHFFASLASVRKECAAGVLLSGSGTDGTLGLKSISDEGGMTIVETPDSATHASIPASAIARGIVDHILTATDIAVELLRHAQHMSVCNDPQQASELTREIIAALADITTAVEKHTGNDFKHYKSTTLIRRVRRRMQVLRVSRVAAYLEQLQASKEEGVRLFHDMLISVTEFFRDAEAFEELADLLLRSLKEEHEPAKPFRVWISGCATGEEAYSIAMLLRELMDDLPYSLTVQIFATDLDHRALQLARAGSFPVGIQDELSPQRLQRFFIKRANRYFIAKEIREMVVFSSHNLISDPPLHQMDLITCRNLLIYLGPHLQQKLIPLFHHALREAGLLFLGSAESMSGHKELFVPLSDQHRIYQRKATAIGSTGDQQPQNSRMPLPTASATSHMSDAELYEFGQRIVLDEFAPQWVIVDDDAEIFALSSDTSRFLKHAGGAFRNNVISMVHPSLRTGLRTAFYEAKQRRRRVVAEHLSIITEQGLQRMSITVQPMPDVGKSNSLHMIVFQEIGEPLSRESAHTDGEAVQLPTAEGSERTNELIEHLEHELAATRSDLERTVQELEMTNQELKSSNEELLSMNEELQATNEELETSKEHLQTSNRTLARSNSDLENFLRSTEIATVFLDREYRIRSFTPAAKSIYALIDSDIGRPLSNLTSGVMVMPPLPTIEQVLRGEYAAEHTLRTTEGHWYIRRVLPYETPSGEIDGLVLTFTDVTELRTEQERLELVLQGSNLGVWDLDLKAGSAWRSATHDRIFGYRQPLKSWTLKDFLKHVHPADVERMSAFFASLQDREDQWDFECRIRRADGETRWITVHARTVRDELGSPIRGFGTVADVTERKQHEELIEDSEAHLRRIIDNMVALVAVLDTQGRLLDVNHTALAAGGLQREDVLGKKFWECSWWTHDAQEVERLKAAIQNALGGQLVRYDTVVRTSDDARMTIDFMLAPVMDASGNITHLIPSGVDITDRKLAENRINELLAQAIESSAKFQTLADNIAQFAWMAEPEGDVFWFNKRWFDYTGTTLEEMRGWNWTNVLHPDHTKRVLKKLRKAFKTGDDSWEDTFPMRNQDGKYRWFLSRMIPIRDEDGKIVRWFGTNTDITRQKQIEEELQQARDMAQVSNQAKSDFLANMSHEIRSPMTAIMGFADLLKTEDEEERQKVETIRRNGHFLLELINDILDLSKIEAGKVDIDAISFSPTQLLEDVCSLMSVRAAESGLELLSVCEGAVPVTIKSDPIRLRQILINLVGNALKFTDVGYVKIKMSYVQAGHQLRFDIIDTGIGISRSQLNRLFRPFEQGDASIVRKYGGSGLGLAISQRLAELLGGHIEARSELGRGSTFSLLVNCGEESELRTIEDILEPGSSSLKELFGESRHDATRISESWRLEIRALIVDDRRDIRFLTQHFVQEFGGQVLTAENGRQAIEIVRQEEAAGRQIDIILMDVQMPVMDGFTAVKKLREDGFEKPIVALTANAMESDREACFAVGYTEYLSKPIDRQQLIVTLRRHCR